MKRNIIMSIIITLLITGGCESLKHSVFNKKEEFDTFNEKFHDDSSFQLSRVDFPIKGYFIENNEEKKWTKENWMIHKTPVGKTKEGQFEVEVIKKEDTVIEKIWIKNSEFYVERRFRRKDGKWYLVFFKDIN
jgi:hypothetical protein